MIVCVCRRISELDLLRHTQQGLCFDAIQQELGVGTQCGSCEDCARQFVARCAQQCQSTGSVPSCAHPVHWH